MAFVTGGKFKAPSTAQTYHHNHASQMAHVANMRLAIGKALGGPKPPVPPVAPAMPVTPVMPGAPGGPAGAPPPGSNFKAHIAHAAAGQGVHASMQHVHDTIDAMTQQGHFTPFQGVALKNHNGPLDPGPNGMNTMGKIVHALVSKGKHG